MSGQSAGPRVTPQHPYDSPPGFWAMHAQVVCQGTLAVRTCCNMGLTAGFPTLMCSIYNLRQREASRKRARLLALDAWIFLQVSDQLLNVRRLHRIPSRTASIS